MKIIHYIIIGFCSFFFLLIGIDKFMSILEAGCSLQHEIPGPVWKVLGVIQLFSAFLIWSSKYRKYIAGFFFVFMLIFIAVHLSQQTYDIGGAALMAVLLGVLVWNPSFLSAR
jgi:hypothetical protein